jgi:hypothetical protein
VYFVLAGMLERGEVATELSEIHDPRWVDIGYGVPDRPAEYYIDQQRRITSPPLRWLVGMAAGYRSYFRRLRSRANIARLFTGTGDKEIHGFFEHWSSLRGGKIMPHLRDFLDRPHPAYQPYLSIIDLDVQGRASVRLMGSERHDLAARPGSSDEPMRVVYSPRLFPKLHVVTLECVTRPCGFRALRTFESGDGQEHRGAVIALPLAVDSGATRTFVHYQHLLGTTAYKGAAQLVTAIHNPQWIDIGAGVPDEIEF